MKKIILTMSCIFLLSYSVLSAASYVRYSVGGGGFNTKSTNTIEYFSTGNGSFSYYSGPVYPAIYNFNQWYYGLWVPAANGDVPYNAFVHHYVNGRPIFSCRSLYNNRLFGGLLVPGEGCYLQIYNNVVRVNVYDVLLR